MNKRTVRKAMVLAGGLGTRFLPVTLAGAKELIAIGNKPILMYHLEDLARAGIEEVLIVGNNLKEKSFKHFLNPDKAYIEKVISGGKGDLLKEYNEIMSKLKITYVNQDDKFQVLDGRTYENDMYDLAGSSIAIYAGKAWANNEPFIIINGDDLCFYDDDRLTTQDLLDVYNSSNGDYVMYGKETSLDVIWKYSSMVLGEKISENGNKVIDIIEKPEKGKAPSNIMGFAKYIFKPDFFERIHHVPPRKNGEYCMVDIFEEVAKEGHASVSIFKGRYFDCGSMEGYIGANVYTGLKNKDSGFEVAKAVDNLLQDYLDKQD